MAIGCVQSASIMISGNTASYYEFDVLTKHTFTIDLNLIDCDGLPIDLTGALVSFGIKESWDSDTFQVLKPIVLDPAGELVGQITVNLDVYETESLERDYYNTTNFLFEINVLGSESFIAIIHGKINAIRGLETPIWT